MPALITTLYVLAALFGAAFAFVELRLIVRFLRHRDAIRASVRSRVVAATGAGAAVEPAPTVTIQIPLYNERRSARQVVLAAAAQDYPPDRFDIQVLDDSTDETADIVREVVGEVEARGIRIEHVRRPTRVGYKAGALAEGLQRSASEFVAVFDADFTPGPDFLSRLLVREAAFTDPDVAFVQTRWALHSPVGNWFSAALALLLDRHFFVQKPTRVFAGHVTTFNGSGGIWRRAAIDAVGGWSSDTLTEDLDLSYRCAMAGWRGHYLHDVSVPNELPGHMRAFKQQQRRWARGNAQCFRKLTGPVMRAKHRLVDRWEEAFLLAGYAIHPILMANLLLWPWAVLYVDRVTFLGLQGLMSLAILVAPLSFLVTLRERGIPLGLDSAGQVLAGVCVGIGLMVNNTVGQIQGFLQGEAEFVRTPKGWGMADELDGRPVRAYRSPLDWTFFAELVVLAYCFATGALLVTHGESLWAIPLFFWGMCVGLVARLQLSPQPA